MNNIKPLRILKAVLLVAVLIGFDQWTKHIAASVLPGNPIPLWEGVFELHYLENTGAAFGVFTGRVQILSIITIAVLAFLVWLYLRIPEERKYLLLRFCLICLFAGGLGNLIDRMMAGYVVDFLYFSLINFPIFNVADIYATCSAFGLIVLFLFVHGDEDLSRFFRSQKDAEKNTEEEKS